jgi:hypothetical protein
VVLFYSENFEEDPYSSAYVGWLQYLFQKSGSARSITLDNNEIGAFSPEEYEEEFPVFFLFVDRVIDLPEGLFFDTLVHNLHERVLVTVLLHSSVVVNYSLLAQERRARGFVAPSIFILNHEQPWRALEGDTDGLRQRRDSMEMVQDMRQVTQSYLQQRRVLRNYHFKPLMALSVYVPLGPVVGAVVGNYTWAAAQPGSWLSWRGRPHVCHFVGRFRYQDSSRYHEQRVLFKALIDSQVLPCVYEWNGESPSTKFGQPSGQFKNTRTNRDFGLLLSQTVFVPCPAGNSPETFRIYEALELGGIPLIVSPDPQDDFLSEELWKDYPGPTFSSWHEAAKYVRKFIVSDTADGTQSVAHSTGADDPSARAPLKIDPSRGNELDTLQRALADWYTHFLEKSRRAVRMAAFPSVVVVDETKGLGPGGEYDSVVHKEGSAGSVAATAAPWPGRPHRQQLEHLRQLQQLERRVGGLEQAVLQLTRTISALDERQSSKCGPPEAVPVLLAS